MAKESSFKNMVITLSVICLICSALLGVVYSVTKAPIEAAELAKINNAIKAVVPECDNNPSEEMMEVEGSVVYPAKVNGNIVGYAIKVKASGFGGPIQMMVGFNADGTIYNTSVISHAETPGLGAKITGEIPTRTQIVGKNPASSNLTVTKDGGEIDAITASTITSRAFLKGVEAAYKVFVELQKQQQPWEN
ncbi:MAG TPA: RnfABCDGE type electron transport complex subunit G [Bacteroidales bacterium]|jgi:electron transport complex protein RnfG|nr:RnfABCDGE type electron transport complex subunit G [Bacteroidales bacterium]HKM12039.1 RnfABCDGE type electron transport complex subunit G [Bacteroidales bacterium]HPY22016.1 RnfABCDGE type electron transport complex subunit G [Bacteroidales bacterium]HQP79221.1 RnfABCDGE type electron transport complex subunit G [Bacteroidales bacterium]